MYIIDETIRARIIEQFKDDVIDKFGFEHVLTVDFFKICEENDFQKIVDTYETYKWIEP